MDGKYYVENLVGGRREAERRMADAMLSNRESALREREARAGLIQQALGGDELAGAVLAADRAGDVESARVAADTVVDQLGKHDHVTTTVASELNTLARADAKWESIDADVAAHVTRATDTIAAFNVAARVAGVATAPDPRDRDGLARTAGVASPSAANGATTQPSSAEAEKSFETYWAERGAPVAPAGMTETDLAIERYKRIAVAGEEPVPTLSPAARRRAAGSFPSTAADALRTTAANVTDASQRFRDRAARTNSSGVER